MGGSSQTHSCPAEIHGRISGYIQESKGEFTVAKDGYVRTKSGWFSERSANYLASGRPVITQETGFSRSIPCGEGLMSFSSPEGALAALDDTNANYELHCRRAREIAEEFFDSHIVLTSLLGQAMSLGGSSTGWNR